jgi:hypothetical protein
VRDPKTDKKLVDLIFSEKHLFNIQPSTSYLCPGHHQPSKPFSVYTLKEEVKFAFRTGLRDSFSLYQKLPDFIPEFKQAFLVHDPRLRFQP